MTPEELLFNEAFKDRGGLCDDLYLGSPIRELTDSLSITLRSNYSELPVINGGSILGTSLSAIIRYYDGKYFLGVNIGCYLLILDMFSKMMATKTVLSGIGNISLLTDEKKVLNALLNRRYIHLDHERMTSDVSQVNDPVRANQASVLITLTNNFIILHELGHIVDGHIGYQIKTTKNFSWEELELSDVDKKKDTLTSQTLEMRADRFAVYHYYFKAIEAIKAPELVPEELKPLYRNIESFIFNLVFALYSFFRLMGFQDFDTEREKQSSHPSPGVRIAMVIDCIMALYQEFHEQKSMQKEHFIMELRSCIINAEKAYCDITYNNYDPKYISEIIKNSSDYRGVLYENYDKLEKLLEPYSLIKKSSPINRS